jgi:drug/metabolite transporter (DMT)-like permease
MIFYIPLIGAAISGILYHITQKSIDARINPFFSMIVTYLVALLISLVLYILDKGKLPISQTLSQLNWATYALGAAIVGIEISFLLAYRSGWNIGKMNLAYTLILTFVLVPIGILFYKETHSIKTLIGIAISIVGILMIKI